MVVIQRRFTRAQLGLFRIVQNGLRILQETLTGCREGHFALVAFQQRDTHALLQIAYLTTQGGLRGVQFFCSSGEV